MKQSERTDSIEPGHEKALLCPRSVDVAGMFASIAGRYDLMNDVLSFGLHRLWRRDFLRHLPSSYRPAAVAVDLCTGSGGMLVPLSRRARLVIGVDFCRPMLPRHASADGTLLFLEADVQTLPLRSESADVITVGFGVRNFTHLDQGLLEAFRVLKPGSYLAILELGQPTNPLVRRLYSLFGKFLMPLLGSLLAGNARAYRYLRETSSSFPCGSAFERILERAGFENISWRPYSLGIAYGYYARKPESTRLAAEEKRI